MLDEENRQFAYELLRDRQSYHEQKENAANTIFLVETSLFGALMATNVNARFPEAVANLGWGFVLLVVFVWCLLHVFMRWQLRNRRIAALQVKALMIALTDHLSRDELRTKVLYEPKPMRTGGFVDFFIPVPASTIVTDVALRSMPDWYRARFLAAQESGTGAGFGEIFPTYGSITMLLAALAYVVFQWK